MFNPAYIMLYDESMWEVDEVDAATSITWLPGSEVVVCEDDRIINTYDNETVEVSRIQ